VGESMVYSPCASSRFNRKSSGMALAPSQLAILELVQCPPCIEGQIVSTIYHDQLVLCCSLPAYLPEVDISAISDLLPADHLGQGRAVFTYPRSDDDVSVVEC
jgi:hypothetical protein